MIIRVLLAISIASASIPWAMAEQNFVVGQKIKFPDLQGKYGGGNISGTIVKDRGATYPFPENRYEIQVDVPGAPALQSVLMGSAAMEAAGSPSAIQPVARPAVIPQNNQAAGHFIVGQKIHFRDLQGKYGGGTIPGTIVKDRGVAYPFPENRYEVRVDLPGAPAAQSVLVGAAAMQGDAGGAPVGDNRQVNAGVANGGISIAPIGDIGRVIQRMPAVQQKPIDGNGQSPVVIGTVGRVIPLPWDRAGAATVPAQAKNAHAKGDWGTPPPKGTPFNYAPNTASAIGNTAITPAGLSPMFVGSGPGDESAVGRWYTHTGGVFTHKNSLEYDGAQKSLWGNPEIASLINIMPGGSYEVNYYGRITTGKWYDVGQNVIRLVNMTPGNDWTASVYKGRIQFKDARESLEGNRY